MNTGRFLKYVWLFFIIIRERVNSSMHNVFKSLDTLQESCVYDYFGTHALSTLIWCATDIDKVTFFAEAYFIFWRSVILLNIYMEF